MSNTSIQIKRSLTTSTPVSLNIGEPAYSYSSNTLFIGTPNENGAIAIGGHDSYLRGLSAYDHSNSAFVRANAASVRANNSLNANTGGVITGDVTIQGNLSIIGGSIGANVPTVLIGDNIITLNTAISQSGQPTMNAGIEIDRGAQPNVYLLWNETDDKWTFTNDGTNYDDLGGSSASSYANAAFLKANAAYDNSNTKVSKSGDRMIGSLEFFGPNLAIGNYQYASGIDLWANTGTSYAQVNYANTNYLYVDPLGAALQSPNAQITVFNTDGIIEFYSANVSSGNKYWRLYSNGDFVWADGTSQNTSPYAAGQYANAAFVHANAAFAAANNVFPQVQPAFNTANAAFLQANAAFIHANSGFIKTNSAFDHANAAFANANGAFAAANAAFANANGAFAKSNAAYNHANSGFIQANAAFIHANAGFIRANNSLNANVGGNVTGEVVIVGNLTSNTLTTTGSNGSITGANAIFSNYFFGANGTVDLYAYTSYAFANANGAFARANAAFANANGAFAAANGAYIQANSAFIKTNAAFDHANAAYISQNATGQYANAAFIWANAAYNQANTDKANLVNSGYTAQLHSNGAFALPGNLIFGPSKGRITNQGDGALSITANAQSGNTGIYLDNAGQAVLYGKTSVLIQTNQGLFDSPTKSFTFNQNGTLTFPDTTIQSTAFIGYGIDNVARDTSNSAFIRANNSLDANLGGTVTANVVIDANLTTQNVFVGSYIDLNTSSSVPPRNEGRIFYDNDQKTLAYNNESDNTIQLGQETVIRVWNNSGTTIDRGKVARIGGDASANGFPAVALASADIAANAEVVGVTSTTIANNDYGYVTIHGKIRGLNTSLLTAGQELFLSDTPGEYQTTAPASPSVPMAVGYVTLSDVTDGSILVYSHLMEGKNKTNGAILFGRNGAIDQDPTKLYWDYVNDRLGIDTDSPQANLHVAGDGLFTGNLTITGNLVISNAQTITTDQLFVGGNNVILSANVTGTPTLNAAIIVNRGDSPNAYILWDETVNEWLAYEGSGEPGHILVATKTANTWAVYDNFAAYEKEFYPIGANLANSTNEHAKAGFATANIAENLATASFKHANSGFIQANSSYAHANAAYLSQNATGQYANAAFIHANSAYQSQNATGQYANAAFTVANGAFIHTNSAFGHANAAYQSQNATGQYANAAFIHANSGYIHVNSAFDHANAAYVSQNSTGNYANAAFANANAGLAMANAAFANANGAFASANAAFNTGNSAFIQANASFDHANAAFAAANNVFPQVQPAYDTANSAFIHANASFDKANNADANALSAGSYANSAFVHANAAFAAANNVFPQVQPAYDTANAAFIHANASFDKANNADANALSAGVYANASFNAANAGFIQANSAYADSNTVSIYANTPSHVANSAAIYANGAFIAANTADDKATSAGVYANGAFVATNVADSKAISAGSYANSAFITANTPSHIANSAAIYANGAFIAANTADDKATSAGVYANGAFIAANTPSHVANSASAYANGAFIAANTADDKATSAGVYANGAFAAANAATATDITQNNSITAAFNHANSGFITANSAGVYANGAFAQSNIALTQANAAFSKANNALANTSGTTFNGDFLIGSGGKLTVLAAGGDEGGEILLGKPPNGTLSGGVVIDAHQNKIRIFEDSGTNRGVYIDLTGAAASVGTNLLAGGGGSVTSVAGATGAVSNTQLINGIKTVSSSQGITFDYVETANNGQGTNYKVGDDAWIGDTNLANTIRIKGLQDATNGYIIFGNNDGKSLGRSGSGPLTYDANTIWHAGNDGSGSGLDADLLDGLNSTDFAKSSAESYANAAFIAANTADGKAVAAGSYANSAFVLANGTAIVANTPSHVANSAAIYANGAFIHANASFVHANAAFDNSNTKFNSTGGTISGNVTIQNDLSVLGNVTFVGNVTSLLVTGNSGQFFGYASNGFNALYAGIPVGYDFQPQTVFQASGNVNDYAQINIQNINTGDQSSSDYVATADNGTEDDTYIDMGIGGSTHADPDYTLVGPNDGYLYVSGNTVTGGGDLVLGTFIENDIVFAVGGMGVENEQMRILGTSNTINIRANVDASLSKSVTLGPIANVHITGGSNDDYIRTDGAGGLTFASLTSADVIKVLYNTANASFIRANNSLNANNGGTVSANVVISANLQAANVASNTYIQFGDGTRQYTANAGSGGGSGGTVDSWSTLADGINSTFTMSFAPTANAGVVVSIGGIVQSETYDYLLTPSNSTISFNAPPPQGERIRVAGFSNVTPTYIDAANSAGATINTFEGTGDGSTQLFNLGFDPISDKAIFVSLGGILQPESAYSVNSLNNTISFVDAPQLNESIRVVGYSRVNPYYIQYISSNVSVSVFETTANGAQTSYQLGFNPQARETLIVTIDGIVQPISSYTVDTGTYTITFDEMPASGELVRVATMYTTANAFVIPDGSVSIQKLDSSINSIVQNAATTGKAIAMSIVFGG